jgi:hypothetical protein
VPRRFSIRSRLPASGRSRLVPSPSSISSSSVHLSGPPTHARHCPYPLLRPFETRRPMSRSRPTNIDWTSVSEARCAGGCETFVRHFHRFWESRLPTSTSISGTSISKNFVTFFPPSSSSYLRATMPVVTNSPNSILHMIVGYMSPASGTASYRGPE